MSSRVFLERYHPLYGCHRSAITRAQINGEYCAVPREIRRDQAQVEFCTQCIKTGGDLLDGFFTETQLQLPFPRSISIPPKDDDLPELETNYSPAQGKLQ
jgi:hypothetical protein